jgi:hypothetical protein
VLPSGWQLAHENVPELEAKLELNAIAPRRTAAGVGSLPTSIFATSTRFDGSDTFTTDTVFSSVFSTYAVCAAPPAPERSATPRGICMPKSAPAPRSRRPCTTPPGVIVKTRLLPADVTTSVWSLPEIAMP